MSISSVNWRGHNFALDVEQKNAWLRQVNILRGSLKESPDFTLYIEFSIPARASAPMPWW